ncbi:DUF3618 domain-containing protein [Actinospica robiniae]|uniref:DUF3618 domain-containing protein n=1 Tax=Actinospica robiniae TaxID=304901 RepID=UPI00040C917C|nr:DUF3618 domain-containing protein [Actinospica robiniae]
MSAKKHAWTGPGAIEDADQAEARKGTAAANPVLSLSPQSQASMRRAAESNGSADHRSPAQIEAEIEYTRDRLAVTLDELTERLTPRAMMRRTNAKARGAFVTPQGGVRKDRAAIVAGSFVTVVSGVVALRLLRRR